MRECRITDNQRKKGFIGQPEHAAEQAPSTQAAEKQAHEQQMSTPAETGRDGDKGSGKRQGNA
jgi:hypothetical protein